MRITNNKLIEEFYELVKDQYPEISLEEFKEVINAPWLFLKQIMETGTLETVRFKYFGTFQVYRGRAKGMLTNLKNRLESPTKELDIRQYLDLKTMLEKFLENGS